MRLALIMAGTAALLVAAGCKKKEAAPPSAKPGPSAGIVPSAAPAAAPAPPPTYRPRYAQRMFEVLTRLYWAGQAAAKGNWGYAHQQAFELYETFKSDLAQVLPAVGIPNGVDLKGLRAAFTDTQLAALLAAAQKKDGAAFDKAYRETAAGCNACHAQVNRGFLVIKERPAPSVEAMIDLDAGAKK